MQNLVGSASLSIRSTSDHSVVPYAAVQYLLLRSCHPLPLSLGFGQISISSTFRASKVIALILGTVSSTHPIAGMGCRSVL